MLPDNPPENPAAVVEELEEKIDKQYPDRPDPDQQPAETEKDSESGASGTTASNVEPPD